MSRATARQRTHFAHRAMVIIAMVVGLSMTAAQAQAVTVIDTVNCCCGMHGHCPCLQHQGPSHPGDLPMLRSCSRGRTLFSAPHLTPFAMPVLASMIAPRVVITQALPLPTPHQQPDPRQPRGPS